MALSRLSCAGRTLRGLFEAVGPLGIVQARGSATAANPSDDKIEVTVNGDPIRIPKGYTVLQACDAAGIDIPRWAACLRNGGSEGELYTDPSR